MKKITALLIIMASLLSLVSCGDDYPAIKSTDEESQTVMSVSYDGEKYEVKYELYRALFVASHTYIDGGDTSVWSGPDKDKYIADIDALIKARAAEIYSVLHIAEKAGINIYSKEYNSTVKEIIAMSVEGGSFGDTDITGFDGSYDKYIEYLAKKGINYSVQDLLIRYYIASEEIYLHYIGNIESEEYLENLIPGVLKYTKDDVRNFYNSEDCVRVIRGFFPSKYFSAERIQELHSEMTNSALKGENAVSNFIIQHSTVGASDVKNGELIAEHNLDRHYSEVVEYAFSLNVFELSPVIKIETDFEDGHIIIYKTAKDDLHFEECYDYIKDVYLQNELGKIIDTAASSIENGLTETSKLSKIDRASFLTN